jgi:hypothetical protein
MNWSTQDLTIVGVLVLLTGIAVWLIWSKVPERYRLFAIIAVLAVAGIIYVDLAVGLFNFPFSGS